MMKIFMIVGEDSGDVIAANLIQGLQKLSGGMVECMGVGGPLMEKAGFESLLGMDEITAFGILEVIPKIPNLLKIKDGLVEEIEKRNPDAVITVDFPEFNFMVAKALKKRGKYKGKLIHYVAPSVWAWREGRAKRIAGFMDGMMCLFPMEVPYFTKHGIRAVHVGHPMVENFIETPSDKTYRIRNDIPKDVVILGLFFGSRSSEYKNMKDIIINAARFVIEYQPKIHIVVPTLQKNEYEVQQFLGSLGAEVFVSTVPDFKWTAFQACDVAIAVSGTVGLELSYARVPHVTTYKVSGLTYFILKLLVKVKNVHLANILLGRDLVPEFVQTKAIPELIAQEVLGLLKKKEKREEMVKGFEEIRALMGYGRGEKPSERAAEFVLSMISGRRSSKSAFNAAARR
jgi:lipid-A-disaccharide synthase